MAEKVTMTESEKKAWNQERTIALKTLAREFESEIGKPIASLPNWIQAAISKGISRLVDERHNTAEKKVGVSANEIVDHVRATAISAKQALIDQLIGKTPLTESMLRKLSIDELTELVEKLG